MFTADDQVSLSLFLNSSTLPSIIVDLKKTDSMVITMKIFFPDNPQYILLSGKVLVFTLFILFTFINALNVFDIVPNYQPFC